MKNREIPRLDLSMIGSEEKKHMDIIDNDFAIFDNLDDIRVFDYPSRIGLAALTICLKGETRTSIDLKEYVIRANDMVITLPDQIIQKHSESDDLATCVIALSPDFVRNSLFSMQQFVPATLHIRDNPCITLDPEEVVRLLEYHSFLRQKVKMKGNKFQKEITLSLLHALFYDIDNIVDRHMPMGTQSKTRKDELFEQFIHTIQQYYKKERSVSFYADKLCLTPKHLSNVLKELTGKSAGEWIDDYVILEAKTLLKSTSLTVLQISEELNFANQSFFGKYFKQHTGMSPMQYRRC